jgi:hypothetical protein
VKKQQIDPVPLVSDAQPPLAGNEGELAAKFQEKAFQPWGSKASSKVFSEYSPLAPGTREPTGL